MALGTGVTGPVFNAGRRNSTARSSGRWAGAPAGPSTVRKHERLLVPPSGESPRSPVCRRTTWIMLPVVYGSRIGRLTTAAALVWLLAVRQPAAADACACATIGQDDGSHRGRRGGQRKLRGGHPRRNRHLRRRLPRHHRLRRRLHLHRRRSHHLHHRLLPRRPRAGTTTPAAPAAASATAATAPEPRRPRPPPPPPPPVRGRRPRPGRRRSRHRPPVRPKPPEPRPVALPTTAKRPARSRGAGRPWSSSTLLITAPAVFAVAALRPRSIPLTRRHPCRNGLFSTLAMAAACAVVLTIAVLNNRRIADDDDPSETPDVIEYMTMMIGVVYAIVLGLAIAGVWEGRSAAQESRAPEAQALHEVQDRVRGLPGRGPRPHPRATSTRTSAMSSTPSGRRWRRRATLTERGTELLGPGPPRRHRLRAADGPRGAGLPAAGRPGGGGRRRPQRPRAERRARPCRAWCGSA